ncbi:DUF3817 domain-containing protein [Mycetocola tolaasinivorans]|uniref:DUF3817 domain-containing protein n=1 Tax=Mycetocola tolaasinivorans TaxID=76635 RepID=A0A3L7ABD4_9MICO|nr:DUF3817 domain-containing protein [Mycetocola tolaasinivorans]RLP77305.1 DUF3817 domain-containing protein [Mycetocola tolaasinivorans]
MPLQPRERDLPKIPGALRFYQITSVITGVLLLLLCGEVLLKWWFRMEIEMGGAFGFLALVPDGTVEAINISLGLLIVHGWFYVVYLVSIFRVWSLMRWGIVWLVLMALGGVIPFLSFFLEVQIVRKARTQISSRNGANTPNAHQAEVEPSH